jgi:hypothetical protein
MAVFGTHPHRRSSGLARSFPEGLRRKQLSIIHTTKVRVEPRRNENQAEPCVAEPKAQHDREIPVELEEAAMVDGGSSMTAFRRIVLPLAAPGLIATAIFR